MINNEDILSTKAVTQVDAIYHTKVKQMPQELKNIVEGFTPMQKRYAEYRSKGMRQADAAKKAGSSVTDRGALGRTGYNWEQIEGMKEYIGFLYQKRAEAATLDEIEILEGLRKTLDRAMELDRMDWANKTLELMGSMIGAFEKQVPKAAKGGKMTTDNKNGTDAFKDEGEEVGKDQRVKDIQSLLHSIQKTQVYKDANKE